MTAVAQRLNELKIVLPRPAAAVANYVPYTLHDGLLVVSGQLPVENGERKFLGCLGRDLGVDEGRAAARLCAVNILSQVEAALGGDWGRVVRLLRLGVFVSSASDFHDHPLVANGASDLMVEVLGEAGRHARAAVGVSALPAGVSVEVDAMFAVR